MIFPGEQFYPLGFLSENVPIITVSGISKEYLVPGWRLGWIVLYNVNGILDNIKQSIINLTTLIQGPNTLIQAALPEIINNISHEYFNQLNNEIYDNTMTLYNEFKKLNKYFEPIKPKGAMYLMVKLKLDSFNRFIKNDTDFCELLLKEQSVFVLPSTLFNIDNYFRCVTCPPANIMKEVGKRVQQFCKKYDKNSDSLLHKL